jgi:nitrite reductase/ring-hydroxylating ferredoxin subunit
VIEYFPVAAVESLAPGKARTVYARGREFALFNLDGQFYATEDRCPHRGASIGAGWLENDTISCPMHGWLFDPRTGSCLSNPDRPLKSFPVRIRDGEVELGLDTP